MKFLTKTAIALAIYASSVGANAATLSLELSDANVLVGEAFTVDVILNQPFEGEYALDTLFAFGYDVNIDTTELSFDSYSLASGWDDDSSFFVDTDIAGSHFPGIDDEGQSSMLLAQMDFTPLVAGSLGINVNSDSISSFNQGLFYLWNPAIQDFSAQTTVVVNEVPVPASGLLFLSALGLLGTRLRR